MMANRTARIASLLCITVALSGCAREPTIEIREGIDICRECNMVIDQLNQACGYVSGSEFVTFDSPGCLLRYTESLPRADRPPPDQIFCADYLSGSLHSVDRLAFLLTSHVPTVMNARVLSFSKPDEAMEISNHPDEVVTDWLGYRTARGTPDVELQVVFGPNGMEPEIITADKDDLVLLRAAGRGLTEDLIVSIRGYPEAGPMTIPASGDPIEFRMLATKPGAGFPIGAAVGAPLGMLKVTGAHTEDEGRM